MAAYQQTFANDRFYLSMSSNIDRVVAGAGGTGASSFFCVTMWVQSVSLSSSSSRSRLRSSRASTERLTRSRASLISCDGMASWTERDYGDECEIVGRFFNHLRARTDRTAIGFGSVATDLPLLQLVAMEYSLQLPGHFLAQGQKIGSPVFAGSHFDLGLAMKGSGRTWHHLSEVILRLGLPAELMTTKKHVQFPTTTEGWADAVAHVELDCALLSVAHLAWSRAQGQA